MPPLPVTTCLTTTRSGTEEQIGAEILFINFFVYPPEWPEGPVWGAIRNNIIDLVDFVSLVSAPFQHVATEAECSNGHTESRRPSVKPTRLIIDRQGNILHSRFGGFEGYGPIKPAAAVAKVAAIENHKEQGRNASLCRRVGDSGHAFECCLRRLRLGHPGR